ncbi:MAG: nitrite reductase small subunit NirD [Rhodospirillum sp.]|nr:nitrite reductase small subunit NirD [Rhodospirillum sp.]MCF8488372.1 nitrite reductase small subunit NirD [Rhodospirillum sp.]MCF8500618.1 nitrite reductase small subunit NirD [Rhodospirillum sp.]
MDQSLRWTDVAAVEDIPRQGSRVITGGADPVAVFRTHDDQIFALIDRCPHKGGPLSQGIVHGASVTCPLHNWVIDLATAEATGPDEGCSGHVPARVERGRVLVCLPQSFGG